MPKSTKKKFAPPVTGGHGAPPLGFVSKLPKNGFSEAPKLNKFLEHFFGQILVKIFFGHMTPFGPCDASKKGSFSENCNFCVFLSINYVFLPRNVRFRLFLVLETLDQPKLAVGNQNFLWSPNMISERSTTVYQNFRCYS